MEGSDQDQDHDDHTNQSTSKEIVVEEEQQQGSSTSPPRSYDCTFCKRGFSNAQALGGHMNIHRRDKAKLKHHQQQSSLMVKTSLNVKRAWNYNLNEDHQETHHQDHDASKTNKTSHGVVSNLPLFVETPSKINQADNRVRHSDTQVSEKVSPSSSSELDLELRLGPEPQEPSSTTGTKKFF